MNRQTTLHIVRAAFYVFAVLMFASPLLAQTPQGTLRVTGKPTVFKVTVTKVELNNGSSFVTVFNGSAQLDLVAGSGTAFPGISGLTIPAGTYNLIRITFLNQFGVQGSLPFNGVTWYVTPTIVTDTGGVASQGSADARSAGEAQLLSSNWGGLGASVTQNVTIPNVTIGSGTAFSPTVKFDVSSSLQLWENAGISHYLTLSPTIAVSVQ